MIRAVKVTAVSVEEYHFYQLHKHFVIYSSIKANSTETKLLGNVSMDVAVVDQLEIGHSAFIRYWGQLIPFLVYPLVPIYDAFPSDIFTVRNSPYDSLGTVLQGCF
jgi:hypothetical protein